MPSIRFCRAAGTVTGPRDLVHTPVGSIAVEGGLSQVSEELPLT